MEQGLATRIQSFSKARSSAASELRDYQAEPDDGLIGWYVAGDNQAFEALYRRHKDPLYRFFRRQLDEQASHDAFQETWSKFIHNATRYRRQGKFKHYLFTIAYNVLHDTHRKALRQVTDELLVEEVAADEETETKAQSVELRAHLLQAISALPAAQRDAWLLKQEAGFTLAEIAELTKTTTESVKSRLRYANDKLKTRMQKYV